MTKVYENILYEGRCRDFFYDTTKKGRYLEKIEIYCSDDGLYLVDENTLIKLLEEQKTGGEMFLSD